MIKLLQNRRFLIVLAVVVVVGALVLPKLLANPWKDLQYATAAEGEFIRDVVVRGELRAERSRSISVPEMQGQTQIVWLAPEGLPVKAGDVVVRMNDADQESRVAQRETDLETANQNLQNFLASRPGQVSSSQASVKTAEYDLELAEMQMTAAEFESDQVKEQRRIDFENAKLSLDNAQRALASQENKLNLQERQYRTRIRQAEQRLRDQQRQLEATILHAPIDGLVVFGETFGTASEGMRKIRIGDSAHRGQAVVTIPDLSQILVDFSVGEGDYRKLQTGEFVEVRIDAIQGPVFPSHLEWVAVIANYDVTKKTSYFKAVARLDSLSAGMRPGMTATLRVIVDKLDKALYIPYRAVFEEAGKTVVFPRRSLPEPREVHLGERNFEYVVVLEGLRPGEEIALSDPREKKAKETAAPSGTSPAPGGPGGRRP
jgi:HlyD family secretion protein